MTPIQTTIIGMGPRGLSILQRIAEISSEHGGSSEPGGQIPMDIHLIDPGECGQGTHSSRQPPHLLTNTVASQLTMFADGRGPSFTEWAHTVGYRRFGTMHYPTGGDAGEAIGDHDYLPRNMLGEYLTWAFDQAVRRLPPHMRVVHHRDLAVDIEPLAAGRLAVRTRKGYTVSSDFVFLATGHCERAQTGEDRSFDDFASRHAARNDRLAFWPNPYPTDKLRHVAPGAVVGVQGLGLTAHDVIAELTVGRGGRFEDSDEGLRYLASGREPKICLFSRNCLPFAARGINQKGITGQHKPAFFTVEAIRRLREQAAAREGRSQLDFEAEILPLLLREMGYAYRMASEQRYIPSADYSPMSSDLEAVKRIIDPLRERRFTSIAEFKKFFLEYALLDLEQADMGNKASPVKAATDVIRDTRQSMREAVEFSGLTPDSHRVFNSKFIPVMNRISFGPPRRRNRELLALFEAGVADLAGGPGCRVRPDENTARFAIETDFGGTIERRHVDVLVAARIDFFHPEEDRSPLTASLLRRGLVRPYRNGSFQPGGIDIDPGGHPVAVTGAPLPNVWAVGYLVEGPRYYTYVLPRFRFGSQFFDDASTCVDELFARLRDYHREGDGHAHPDRRPASVS